MSRVTRRALIGRGLGAAATAVVPISLLTADRALAQETAETDALERLLELERGLELAYSLAVEEAKLDGDAGRLFATFGRHAGDHATALEAAIEQLDVDPPDASSSADDYESLADLDTAADQEELVAFIASLESDLIAAWETETAELDAPDLVRTAAQVGASHAQALVALRLFGGESGPALTRLPASPAPEREEEESEADTGGDGAAADENGATADE